MRIADYYNWAAIEKISEFCPDGDVILAEDVGDLGISLRKTVKKIGKTVKRAVSSTIKRHRALFKKGRQFQRAVWKKVAPERLQRFTSRLGKKGRGWFLKAAPFIAIAAQALNFIIPGLGVAVSLAVSAGATAIQLHDAKKAEREMKKLDERAEAEIRAEVKAEEDKANTAMMAAYDKGTQFFTEAYDMTREKFAALPLEGKSKFLNIVIYDQNSENMEKIGVTRDAFQKMTLAEEQEALAHMAQYLEGAPGAFDAAAIARETPTPVLPPEPDKVTVTSDERGVPTIAPTAAGEGIPWLLVGGGVALLFGVVLLAKLRKA